MSEEEKTKTHPLNYDKLIDISVKLVTELGSTKITVAEYETYQRLCHRSWQTGR